MHNACSRSNDQNNGHVFSVQFDWLPLCQCNFLTWKKYAINNWFGPNSLWHYYTRPRIHASMARPPLSSESNARRYHRWCLLCVTVNRRLFDNFVNRKRIALSSGKNWPLDWSMRKDCFCISTQWARGGNFRNYFVRFGSHSAEREESIVNIDLVHRSKSIS